MSEILIIAGIVIAFGATIVRIVFSAKQIQKRNSVKNMPLRYKEWQAQYKTRRGYILIAQLIGIAISIVGLSI
ncbi:MAG: hypothetical protein K2N91_07410 [Muribaculaceae bacterium]|nr:hypothetical protein [Muribaculaceae bacterium]